MMALEISHKATVDLQHIWEFTFENLGKLQADRYIDLFDNEFRAICRFPTMGKSQEHILSGYRSVIVKSHLIFYKLKSKDIIQVVRILHHSMDLNEKLFL